MAKTFEEWLKKLDSIGDRKNFSVHELQDAWHAGYDACNEWQAEECERYAYANIKERLKDEYGLPEYTNSNYQQFCSDVLRMIDESEVECFVTLRESDEDNEWKPDFRHYHGRFYYKGPAVVVTDVADFMRHCTVRCDTDNMGHDYIVYPR